MSEARKPYDIDSLTDVALRVFAERGYDGASMDDVARAAGISKASIYHHVESKETLLARGLERALDALFAVLSEQAAERGPAVERLAFIVRRAAETTLTLLPELSVLFRLRANSRAAREAIARRRSFDLAMRSSSRRRWRRATCVRTSIRRGARAWSSVCRTRSSSGIVRTAG